MAYYKLNIDGTIQSRSEQVDDSWLPLSELETKEDGSYYTYYKEVDGEYQPDLVKEQELEKAKVLTDANADYESQVKSLTADVPESEKLTWTKQETEARGWTADNSYPTPLVDGIVATRGVDKAELVAKIIVKADLYAVAVGQLTGLRQAIEDAN